LLPIAFEALAHLSDALVAVAEARSSFLTHALWQGATAANLEIR